MHSGAKDTVVQFEKLVYYTDSGNVLDYKHKAAPTVALMKSDQPRDIAEFQWRLSRPIATILLALIAVPFSRVPPRQEKGEKNYYAAAIVFAIYYILNGLAQTWVEQGTIGKMPGVWWLYVSNGLGRSCHARAGFPAEDLCAYMSVINRYLATQVLIGLGIAVAVLLPLFSFLDLLDQLDDVGKGTYRVQDAFLHTALASATQICSTCPFIALLGNVIGLGRLAMWSELTALRVAGVFPLISISLGRSESG